MPKTIDVTELVLRDAHQSLMATRMAMEDMIPACADLDQAGYWSVECWGGATFDSCIRFLNEDPWERLRQFRKLLPNTPPADAAARPEPAGLPALRRYRGGPLRGEGGRERHGRFPRVRRAERHAQSAARRSPPCAAPASTRRAPSATPSARCTPPGDFVEMAEKLLDLGCDSICIKDMAALLKPQPAYDIVKGIKEACGRGRARSRARARHHRRHPGQPHEGHRSRRGLRRYGHQLAEPGTGPQSHREPGGDAGRHRLRHPARQGQAAQV